MSKRTKMLEKSAFDCSHIKSVRAWAILHGGKEAGRILANFSDNPNGAVCTLTIHFWSGPLGIMPNTTGQAGGYGYDKFSAACADALDRMYGLEAGESRRGSIVPWIYPEQKEAWDRLKTRNMDKLPTKEGGWSDMSGAGESAVVLFLESHGYTVFKVL